MLDKKTLSRRAFLHYTAVAGAGAALAACAPATQAPAAPAESAAQEQPAGKSTLETVKERGKLAAALEAHEEQWLALSTRYEDEQAA